MKYKYSDKFYNSWQNMISRVTGRTAKQNYLNRGIGIDSSVRNIVNYNNNKQIYGINK